MALVLATHPLLQRRHFRTSRRRLEGKEVIVFSSEDLVSTAHQGASATSVEQSNWTKSLLLNGARVFLSFLLIASIVAIGSLVLPEASARLFPEQASQVVTQGHPTPQPLIIPEVKKYQPPFDETLPEGTWLHIPSIGVETAAQPTLDSAEALATGVWMVPDFGRPGDETGDPIIMAAHRFGWQWWWKGDYWRQHSFYLLTETGPGDRVEVIHDQRRWVYEIYQIEEGEEITDYEADLILYTCKFLNSPIRYFRYARLVEEVSV